MSDSRQIIRERAAARGLSLSALSIMAGRNAAYMRQFMERGSPRKLPEDERRLIAMALDVDETQLGARMPWMPAVGHAAADHGCGSASKRDPRLFSYNCPKMRRETLVGGVLIGANRYPT